MLKHSMTSFRVSQECVITAEASSSFREEAGAIFARGNRSVRQPKVFASLEQVHWQKTDLRARRVLLRNAE